ncbi:aminotransferase [Labrys wisconsinensis]|uniref:4-aminobutyrate--pyruvate transaminase n=1 Tax=Labrys wisconsinensis TaxID=425677 RepID=A0ABU0J888_9HYPH|nr:aminotransferase [Labrys wisconsinensis]MDQ0469815.1 4-aminobutyrate--pyruvate transaminase [Labrys wisconsinensis]
MSVTTNSPFARDAAFHLHPQTNLRLHEQIGPTVIRGGEGVHVVDVDGNRFIEGMSGLWCAALGFSNRRLADAAHRQLLALPYQQAFAHRVAEPVIDLTEALVERAPAGLTKVMLQSSGSEAVDTAIKLVWYYHEAIGKPEKRKIIGRARAYHGTTVASASLTGLPNMHRGFGIPLPGFLHVSCPHHYRQAQAGESEDAFAVRLARELEETILREGPDTVGAFFAEPVMGTGGVIVPPAGYFEKVQAVLRRHDVLMVADEVICGFGRTGHYWGCDAFGIRPDMLTCAKGLSSAYFPISALMVSEPIYQAIADQTDRLGGFGQGFTYGGHPVGAAVALETLRIYDEIDIVGRARRMGALLQEGLRRYADHPLVGEVRGIGMMAALEMVADKRTRAPYPAEMKVAARVSDALRARGVLLRALGDSLLCAPPLIIEEAELATVVDAVGEALDQVQRDLAGLQ